MEKTMNEKNTNVKEDPQKKTPYFARAAKCMMMGIMVVLGLGLVFWLLWNWALVPLFAFPSMTYLQSLGAILLTGVLVRMGRHMGGRQGSNGSTYSSSRCNWPCSGRTGQADSA